MSGGLFADCPSPAPHLLTAPSPTALTAQSSTLCPLLLMPSARLATKGLRGASALGSRQSAGASAGDVAKIGTLSEVPPMQTGAGGMEAWPLR